jgi:hypothetical protein
MPAGTDCVVLLPGGGEHLMVRGSTLLFKAVAAATGGAFSLHGRCVPAGGSGRRRTSTRTGLRGSGC